MTHLMVMSPPSTKPVLVLSLDFGLTGSESLQKLGDRLTSPTLCLKCVLLIKTRQRSSAWALLVGKHQQNQNFIYSSLTLGTWNKMKLILCVLFNYVMGDKTKILFKFIWQKRLSCLTYGRIVYLYIIYRTLYDYDYHLPEIGCALFSLFG